jgi:hypothetical protein
LCLGQVELPPPLPEPHTQRKRFVHTRAFCCMRCCHAYCSA